MELRHLRYFLSVADLGGFSRAADHLGVSQPSLSRQVRDLERELGVDLFDRSHGRARLTYAGHYLVEEVRRILSSADVLKEHGRRAALGQVGRINLGLLDAYAWRGPVPRTIHRFRLARPDVDLNIQVTGSQEQLEGVREGRLDAGFFFHRPASDEWFKAIPILEDRFLLAIHSNSRLARRPPRRLKDLAGEGIIWLPRSQSPAHYDRVIGACHSAGLVPRIVQEAPTATAMLALVSAGAGCTFVLSEVRRRKPPSVTLVPLSDLRFSMTLELVWRASNESPALRAFVAQAVVRRFRAP